MKQSKSNTQARRKEEVQQFDQQQVVSQCVRVPKTRESHVPKKSIANTTSNRMQEPLLQQISDKTCPVVGEQQQVTDIGHCYTQSEILELKQQAGRHQLIR